MTGHPLRCVHGYPRGCPDCDVPTGRAVVWAVAAFAVVVLLLTVAVVRSLP